jgi:hypothetical protein
MAFCPECGKSATAEAARCFHCGHELPALEKPAAGGRFKGTMMMAAPVIPKPATPANANAAANANAMTPAAPPPVQAAAAAVPQAAPAVMSGGMNADAARPAKVNVKSTMIGAGIAPVVVKPAAMVQQGPQGQPDARRQVGLAQTQALYNLPAIEPPVAQPLEAADASASGRHAFDPNASDAHRYLPGDPMAPQAPRAGGLQLSAARGPAPRLLDEDELRAYGESLSPAPMKDRKLMLFAVGGVVLLSVLLLAFGLMR